jgi:deoxycytidine triphosphate deaminase
MKLLSDRGIKEAEAKRLIRIDPKPENVQRQPASLDLKYSKIEDYEPMHGIGKSETEYDFEGEDILVPKYETDVRTETSMIYDPRIIKPYFELRSSMRRLGCFGKVPMINCAYEIGSMGPESLTTTLEIVNFSNFGIKLNKGDRIAQVMFTLDSPSLEEIKEHDISYLSSGMGIEEFKQYAELDHGYSIDIPEELSKLSSSGYFSFEPQLRSKHGMVEVHAGKRARIIHSNKLIDFDSRPKLSEISTDVDLPYRLKPGEFIDVDTVESMDLSRNVGILFYNEYTFQDFFRSLKTIKFRLENSGLLFKWDGWVDPGFKSPYFSRQPKILYPDKGRIIKPGDIMGFGQVFFFPNGVERAYGSGDLSSQYQGK